MIFAYHLRTKNDKPINIILGNIEIFKSKLSDQEYVVFKNIIDSYPNAVTFPNLLSIYEPDLSYESKIKKLRLSLFNIKTLVRKVSKKSTISVRKNKNDRRSKKSFLNNYCVLQVVTLHLNWIRIQHQRNRVANQSNLNMS